jgi:hypothetical protein
MRRDGCHGYANFLAAYFGKESGMGSKIRLSTMTLGVLSSLILATTLCAQEGGSGAAGVALVRNLALDRKAARINVRSFRGPLPFEPVGCSTARRARCCPIKLCLS